MKSIDGAILILSLLILGVSLWCLVYKHYHVATLTALGVTVVLTILLRICL